jgi:hypothetical protein
VNRFYRERATRPQVEWSRRCPKCRRADSVGVRSTQTFRFWYCQASGCDWACWRPPAGRDCPKCGGAMMWSHRRLSVGCDACGFRLRPEEGRAVPAGS